MIRQVEVFETADGKRFDDESKAADHVTDSVREILDARLSPLLASGRLGAADRYVIIMALVPDALAAQKLYTQMSPWVNY